MDTLIGSATVTTQAGTTVPAELRAENMVGRTPIPELVGFSLDDAVAWAEDRGWTEIEVIDVQTTQQEGFDSELRPGVRIFLRHADNVVVSAVAE